MNYVNKINEMEYKDKCEIYRLADGLYNGYKYYILSLGSHPCCYVDLGENKDLYDILIQNESLLDVHGGITYDKNTLATVEDKGLYIGWDYAHAGDYTHYRYFNTVNDKKYTTDELIFDCQDAIEKINQIKSCLDGSLIKNIQKTKDCILNFKNCCEDKIEETIYGGMILQYVKKLFDVY